MWSLLVFAAPAMIVWKWYWYKRTAEEISKKYSINVEFGIHGITFYNKDKPLPSAAMVEIVKAGTKDRTFNLVFVITLIVVILISGILKEPLNNPAIMAHSGH